MFIFIKYDFFFSMDFHYIDFLFFVKPFLENSNLQVFKYLRIYAIYEN